MSSSQPGSAGGRGAAEAGPSRDSRPQSQSESEDDDESPARSGMRAGSMHIDVEWDSES